VEKNRVIVLENTTNIRSHARSFKTELLMIPGIEAVSFTNCIPTRGTRVSSEVSWEGRDPSEKLHFWCVSSDFDYNKVVKVNIIDGRFFNPSFSTDSDAYLINDIAAGVMKKKDPVGSVITFEGRKGTIIGVFTGFHSIDLAGPIVPAIMRIKDNECPVILVKFSSGSFRTVAGAIEGVYKQYEQESVFKATLFRDLTPYSDLSLPSKLVGLAFIIALMLACMGLFGLASFTSENRTKEIGIRKANGATTFSVVYLLLSNYAKWLTIAFIIALPISYIIGNSFLRRFNFHAQMPLWAFFAGPAMACFVALLAVSSQTWLVANRNPVDALRYE
jgi:ABC-type antimicrobial peptide transport system permease subunit